MSAATACAPFCAGPLHRLEELDLLHVDYASAARGESLFIFAMIHNSCHEDFWRGPGPFHEFFRPNSELLNCPSVRCSGLSHSHAALWKLSG